jgi:tRNA A-37 threonylcarbamoyl transferase component Bud32
LYVAAASFCGYLALNMYLEFHGPETLDDMLPVISEGRMVLLEVSPGSPGARAGLKAGDRVLAVEGQAIHSGRDWIGVRGNFEVGSPQRWEIERGDKRLQVVVTLGRRAWSRQGRLIQLAYAAQYTYWFVALVLALVIAFSRPHDSTALLGAWLFASTTTGGLAAHYGFTAAWRHAPALPQALLWIPAMSTALRAPLCLTFFALFPRKLFRSPWPLRLVWLVGIGAALPQILFVYRMVYTPEHTSGTSQIVNYATEILLNLSVVGGLIALAVNYRRLDDRNERRRVRVLVLGTVVAALEYLLVGIMQELFPGFASTFFSTPAFTVGYYIALLLIPISFAYALLRYRLFDIRLIVRQGLQYALARGFVLSAVPLLAVPLLLDLWLHADQSLAAIMRERGWVYAGLAGLTLLAYTQRRKWLDSIDRRFFRDRYDAQGLLRDVVQGIRVARNIEQEAPRVVARIEAALHLEFAALLVRDAHEPAFRPVAAAPTGYELPTFPAESKLMALLRVLGKPLEVPHSDSSWLQQKLPREETEFLRRARIDVLVPVETSGEHGEAVLVLGAKRSEEPYSSEDQDLLSAIAASLAILLEKPPATVEPRRDLFQECPECGACYDTGVTRCPQDSTGLLPVAMSRLLGGRYRLQRRLGRGGMATVYEASDLALERQVAVKMIRDDLLASADAAERFRREARAAAAFAHPNVVTVYDFGLTAGDRAFLVMELLRGVTLRGEIRKEMRLTAPRTLAILRGVCAAIEAAHARDLVHRDLKPENIFLACGDSQEVPKVLDFGVARLVRNTTQETTVDTDTGMLLGTLRYMSPEQLRGEFARPAWDLWALAVVAYEMLTGAHPFAGESSIELLRAIVASEAISLAVHLPAAPKSWQGFFDRAFACDAALRPRSAKLFLDELQSALA